MPRTIITTEIFITRSHEIHGDDTYGYSKSIYTGSDKKLIIICPISGHGEFTMTPSSHLRKTNPQGCPKCGRKKAHTTEWFKEKARETHGNTYDYGHSIYKGSKKSIKINCPKPGHGNFKIRADSHIYGEQGCPKCGNESR